MPHEYKTDRLEISITGLLKARVGPPSTPVVDRESKEGKSEQDLSKSLGRRGLASSVFRARRGNTRAIRQEVPAIIESHYTVAEQGPTLFRVSADGAGCVMIGGTGGRARGRVSAHGMYLSEPGSSPDRLGTSSG